MTEINNTSHLALANLILRSSHEQISNYDLPDFGSSMLSHHSFSVETAAATIQRSRFLSKFFRPTAGAEKILRQQCFDDWIAYEDRLFKARLYSRKPNGDRDVYAASWWLSLTAEQKKVLFKARESLHDAFSRFKIDLHNARVEFTPGETNWSSEGKVSVLQKLKNIENWQVTADAFEDFCRLTYHNASLKRAAKAHFLPLSRRKLNDLNFYNDYSGYQVFRSRFKEMVVIAYGSVGDSVPKNNEKRRFINKEPMGNMILQRIIAGKLRFSLNKRFGNDLTFGQTRHRCLIQSSDNSTIDFSNASDSIHTDLAYFLFPAALRKYLFKYRSDFVLIDEDYYAPEKLCSMGNGFCFEILTLILLSISRALDATSSVYGDDVIIKNETALAFTSVMSTVGFTVNEKKSFISSEFRESCGAFFFEGAGYLTTFDFKWIENPLDFIVTCNKIYKLINTLPPGEMLDLFKRTWEMLIDICPPCLQGPDVRVINLEQWVINPKYVKTKRKKDKSGLRTKLIEDTWLALAAYHIDVSDVSLLTLPKFVPTQLTPIHRHVRCPFQLGHYMYGKRASIDRVRGKPNAVKPKERRGLWQYSNFFILPTGLKISIKELVSYNKEILSLFAVVFKLKELGSFTGGSSVITKALST